MKRSRCWIRGWSERKQRPFRTNTTKPQKLETAIDQLHRISFQILRRTPDFLVGWFEHLVGKREVFNDQIQAKNLIEAGKKYIAANDYDKLVEVDERLHSLLPQQ